MSSDRSDPINEIIKPQEAGRVVWITGLSGAGKSVLAAALVARLRDFDDKILLLDGDELREVFGATSVNVQNYSRDFRNSNQNCVPEASWNTSRAELRNAYNPKH